MIAKAVRCLSGRDLREFGRARLQCWQSSRSSSSPPLRSPPIPLAVALPQTFPQAPLGVHGVKYRTPSRRNMLVVPPSATLERRLADHGLSPAACLFRDHVIAASSNQIGRPARLAYQSCEAAADTFDRDQKGLAAVPFGSNPGDDQKANSSSSSPIFWSITVASNRPANAKLSRRAAAADVETTGMTRQFSCRTG
jgi:hypothetical protein